jgi:uncharacterized protein YukE
MADETFLRELIMDVDVCNESHQILGANIGVLAQDLDDIDRELKSGLRHTWQGNSAAEFFALYDQLYPVLIKKITALDGMSRKFQTEIQDWIEMAQSLAP